MYVLAKNCRRGRNGSQAVTSAICFIQAIPRFWHGQPQSNLLEHKTLEEFLFSALQKIKI